MTSVKRLPMAEPPLIRANLDIIHRIIDFLEVTDFFAFTSVSYICCQCTGRTKRCTNHLHSVTIFSMGLAETFHRCGLWLETLFDQVCR